MYYVGRSNNAEFYVKHLRNIELYRLCADNKKSQGHDERQS